MYIALYYSVYRRINMNKCNVIDDFYGFLFLLKTFLQTKGKAFVSF